MARGIKSDQYTDPIHAPGEGSRSLYNARGCRCFECVTANRKYSLKYSKEHPIAYEPRARLPRCEVCNQVFPKQMRPTLENAL
jgi:hypothetical protein